MALDKLTPSFGATAIRKGQEEANRLAAMQAAGKL
jgi:hypothetical protein